jgi:hypothetical protein
MRTHAGALTSDSRIVSERQMDDPPFTAIHRAEVERQMALFHLLRGGKRAEAKFFDP